MLKRALIAIALSWIVWGCGTSSQYGTQAETDKGEAPVIIAYYAVEVIRPGATWRVYLHARDEDGDMRDIACVLEQRGHDSYPTSVTSLVGRHRREVKGYLFLRTPVDSDLKRDLFTLRVLVRDGQGNRSEPLELPLRFAYVPTEKNPDKWEKSAVSPLGTIKVEIKSSFIRSGRRSRP